MYYEALKNLFSISFQNLFLLPSALIYWMRLTWKKALDEVGEKLEFENKNGNGKVNQKVCCVF